MTFGLIYLGVFVILIWAFLLSSNLGAGYRYKFWPVSAPERTRPYPNSSRPITDLLVMRLLFFNLKNFIGLSLI